MGASVSSSCKEHHDPTSLPQHIRLPVSATVTVASEQGLLYGKQRAKHGSDAQNAVLQWACHPDVHDGLAVNNYSKPTGHLTQHEPSGSACGTFSDIHPVSGTDGAATPTSSSASSSCADSFHSRCYTNDDTIPQGQHRHSLSDADSDESVLVTGLTLQAGQIVVSPTSGAAGTVNWSVSMQQLVDAVWAHRCPALDANTSSSQSNMDGIIQSGSNLYGGNGAIRFTSPTFAVALTSGEGSDCTNPVQAAPEWSLVLEQVDMSLHDWQLLLHLHRHSYSGSGLSDNFQVPASSAKRLEYAAAAAVVARFGGSAVQCGQVACEGHAALVFSSLANGRKNLASAGFQATLREAERFSLPLTIRLPEFVLHNMPTSQQLEARQEAAAATGNAVVDSQDSDCSTDSFGEPTIGSAVDLLPSSSSSEVNCTEELQFLVTFTTLQFTPAGNAAQAQLQQQQQHVTVTNSSRYGRPLSLQTRRSRNTGSSSSDQATEQAATAAAAAGTQASSTGRLDASQTIVCSSPSSCLAPAGSVRQLEAVLLSTSPRLLVTDNFFDAATCEGLMELAQGKLVRSRVASGSETPSRTSWSHFFVKDAARHGLVAAAEAQIEALFKSAAVRGPFKCLAKVEAMQVVQYHEGEFYHEHYDNRADSPLTRAATIIVYLSDTAAGGATSFSRAVNAFPSSVFERPLPPKVTTGPGGRGIKVFPVQGRALVFWSKRPDGQEDPNSIHAADEVEKGEKWIATRWMKDAE